MNSKKLLYDCNENQNAVILVIGINVIISILKCAVLNKNVKYRLKV